MVFISWSFNYQVPDDTKIHLIKAAKKCLCFPYETTSALSFLCVTMHRKLMCSIGNFLDFSEDFVGEDFFSSLHKCLHACFFFFFLVKCLSCQSENTVFCQFVSKLLPPLCSWLLHTVLCDAVFIGLLTQCVQNKLTPRTLVKADSRLIWFKQDILIFYK